MLRLGDAVSLLGVLLIGAGFLYWVLFFLSRSRTVVLRYPERFDPLGNTIFVGMIVFVLGRVIAKLGNPNP